MMKVATKRARRSFPGDRSSFCRLALVLTVPALGTFAALCVDASAQQAQGERQAQNAADYYRQAAAALDQLPPGDRALIDSTAELRLLTLYGPSSPWSQQALVRFSDTFHADEETAELVARLDPAIDLLRRGAQLRKCDWGFDFHSGNLSSPIPQLAIVPDLVQCALFRARYYWVVGRTQEAVDDLQALKAFAVHVGAMGDGGLISLVVQFNIERVVIYTISQWLVDAGTARTLYEVAAEPDRPAVNLPKKALLLETKTVLPLARNLIDTSDLTADQRRERYEMELFTDVVTIGQLVKRYSEKGLLEQIEASSDHYVQVGRLLDLPLDEFHASFDPYMRELAKKHNFFSDVGLVQCPGIERVYYDVKEMRVRWRMLQAAIDVAQSGAEVLSNHNDPFGDGPFTYRRTQDGFELVSRLSVNGARVSTRFNAAPGAPDL